MRDNQHRHPMVTVSHILQDTSSSTFRRAVPGMSEILRAFGTVVGIFTVPLTLYFGFIRWKEHLASFRREEQQHERTGEFPAVDYEGLRDPNLSDTGEWLRIARGHAPTQNRYASGYPSAEPQAGGSVALLERPRRLIELTEQTPTGTYVRPGDIARYGSTSTEPPQPRLVRPYIPTVAEITGPQPAVDRNPQRAVRLFIGLTAAQQDPTPQRRRPPALPEPPLAMEVRRRLRATKDLKEQLAIPLTERYEPHSSTPLFNKILEEWRARQDRNDEQPEQQSAP